MSSAEGCLKCRILDEGFRHSDTEWDGQVHPWSMISARSETALQVSITKSHPGIRDGDVLYFYTPEGEAPLCYNTITVASL